MSDKSRDRARLDTVLPKGRRASAVDTPAGPIASRFDLLAWYDRSRRRLPWRTEAGEQADPWAILVSEIMLQQTTVATVRRRFGDFLARFPAPGALAGSSIDEVLHAWQGLGYYRRARALKACADAIEERHGGSVPDDFDALSDLPGLGPYTARAIAAIAFGQPVVPVDANVARVVGRLIALEEAPARAMRRLQAAADTLASPERAGDVAQALMELGALICTPRSPSCLLCPWRNSCKAFKSGRPQDFPGRPSDKERVARFAVAYLLERPDGAVLFRRRPETGVLAGMIELPSTAWQPEPPDDQAVRQAAPLSAAWTSVDGEVRHLFTHLDLSIRLMRAKGQAETSDGIWATPARFGDLALPSLTVKLLRRAGIWRGMGDKGSR